MKLYLVQHGLSFAEDVDPERSLSPEGKESTRRSAEFLKSKNIKVDVLWHSEKKRARETAKIIATNIDCEKTHEKTGLKPNDPVGDVQGELQALNTDVMIVGHLPFLSKLASLLLTGSEEKIEPVAFKNSGVVCLERDTRWRLAWVITPELL